MASHDEVGDEQTRRQLQSRCQTDEHALSLLDTQAIDEHHRNKDEVDLAVPERVSDRNGP